MCVKLVSSAPSVALPASECGLQNFCMSISAILLIKECKIQMHPCAPAVFFYVAFQPLPALAQGMYFHSEVECCADLRQSYELDLICLVSAIATSECIPLWGGSYVVCVK